MSLLTKAKHEVREVGLATLYFLFCFGVILTLKKLFLAAYQIEFYAVSVVVFAALVSGKVVVVLDHTPLGTRFAAGERPGLASVYKTLIYGGATFLTFGAYHLFVTTDRRLGQGTLWRAIWSKS